MNRDPIYDIRALTAEEYPAWGELVAHSPQAGLFQTIQWNQALCETGRKEEAFLPLVCVRDGVIAGGIVIRYRRQGGRKLANLPAFGYNGPAIAAKLNYASRCQTIQSYRLAEELLRHVRGLVERMVIHNQPEIWDMRPFTYQDWRLETSFTHLFHREAAEVPLARIDPDLREQISSELERMVLDAEPSAVRIREFCSGARKLAHADVSAHAHCASTLERRIHHLTDMNLCRLVTVRGQNGKASAISLLLLSRENRTIYVWKTIPLEDGAAARALPFLLWLAPWRSGEGFERIDLGSSEDPLQSRLRDRLGCELQPRYSARI